MKPENRMIVFWIILVFLFCLLLFLLFIPNLLFKDTFKTDTCYREITKTDPFGVTKPSYIYIIDKKEGWVLFTFCGINRHSMKQAYFKSQWEEVPCPEGCK